MQQGLRSYGPPAPETCQAPSAGAAPNLGFSLEQEADFQVPMDLAEEAQEPIDLQQWGSVFEDNLVALVVPGRAGLDDDWVT